MLSIVCDACKKAVPGPEKETGVVYITDKALCKRCEKKLLDTVSEEMSKHKRFVFSDYKDQYIKSLNQLCK
jgi:hypothetical protein